MQKKFLFLLFVAGFLISGCASQSGWSPTVDSYGSTNPDRIAQDRVECRRLAEDAAGSQAQETGKGALIGGALGAAAGAAIGAAAGSPGTGAAIGAASGGMLGGGKGAYDSNETFKETFRNCLRNRGHNVVN